jgi:DNA-binding Lrp family transcriptional regulator
MKTYIQGLKSTDQNVLEYLNELILNNDRENCTVSIPKIASACNISERQVQISTRRLIDAGLIKRIGYDLSNPDRSKRGTIYKVLLCEDRDERLRERAIKKSSIKFLLFWSED